MKITLSSSNESPILSKVTSAVAAQQQANSLCRPVGCEGHLVMASDAFDFSVGWEVWKTLGDGYRLLWLLRRVGVWETFGDTSRLL